MSAANSSNQADASVRAVAIERLPFVEGIRGVAALIVVLGHIATSGGYMANYTASFFSAPTGQKLLWFSWPGTQMVYLFLMVSGFSLCYSEDRRRLRRGATAVSVFARRRAWRILPTYFAAVALGLIVLGAIPDHLFGHVDDFAPGPVTWGGVLSHLVLLQNVQASWWHQINAPLWSMATEAQLYIVFPLLYFASRRYRPAVVLVAVVAVDLILHLGSEDFWLLFLLRWFALGIFLAQIYRSALVRRIPPALLVSGAVFFLVLAYLRLPQFGSERAQDFLWAMAFGLGLLAMTTRPESRANPMNTRPIRWVGLRSYSLYALHIPVVLAVYAGLGALGMATGAGRTALMFVVGLPVVFAVVEVAYRLVEIPALRRTRAAGSAAPIDAEAARHTPHVWHPARAAH
jgi:peptidoglycan/LPS O-acetylase OafA/YrhL